MMKRVIEHRVRTTLLAAALCIAAAAIAIAVVSNSGPARPPSVHPSHHAQVIPPGNLTLLGTRVSLAS